MYVCSQARGARSVQVAGVHRLAWLPSCLSGSMMFWTIALVLGAWSLMVVSDGALEALARPRR